VHKKYSEKYLAVSNPSRQLMQKHNHALVQESEDLTEQMSVDAIGQVVRELLDMDQIESIADAVAA